MPKTILVLGSSGKTGQRVCAKLEGRGVEVRPVSRKTAIPFDWGDRSTWDKALEGTAGVYLLHPEAGSPDAFEQIEAFAKSATLAGVEKAVLISVPDDGTEFTDAAQAAEQAVRNTGIALTVLRLRWFMQNFSEDFLFESVKSGEIRAPAGDGEEPFVDAEDIAAVAVEALLDHAHDGKTYELSGPRLLSFEDAAQEISGATGGSVKYVSISVEQFVAEQVEEGVPRPEAKQLGEVYRVILDRRIERISPDVKRVLGRDPRDFSEFVDEITLALKREQIE